MVAEENVFVKKQCLEELASNVWCPNCFEKMKCIFKRQHANSSFKVVYRKCKYVAKSTTEDDKSKKKGLYEITVMLVYTMILLGYRCIGVEKLCGLINTNHISSMSL